ncbi:hypothetical protein [Haloferax sp. ATB1]|uniref:hypothetical protein n=1 Tax=Haloferax sp. ATB1 TaxID=1508454 RepID=UPI0005B2219C|nr:hypothetical protein [Haloferax sp. ATB1]
MGRRDDLNEERMRLLGSRLAALSMVESVHYFPLEKPDRVVASFEETYYPDVVDAAALELRLRLNGEFNLLYRERWAGDRWVCRWDRHPNTHNTDDHFHVPPRPSETTALDAEYPADMNDVLRLVFETIEARVNEVWAETTAPVYPTEYGFERQYELPYLTNP